MGYSIAIRARNKELRKRMVAFMNKHWRKWSDVLGKGESVSARPGLGDEGSLDYDHSSDAVGFDYAAHCHGWESCLIYSQTRWMAIKIGKRKSKFSKDDVTPNVFPDPVPFMVYDGYQSWPILVVENLEEAMKLPETARWCATDKLGVYVDPEVNEVLTNYATEVFFDEAVAAALARDCAEILPLHATDFEAWREKHIALKLKHARPEIDKMLPLVRAEVARLDALWEAETKKVGSSLTCTKSLYKSTYRRNAFTKGKKYEIVREDDLVWLKDETGQEFNFTKAENVRGGYGLKEYFRV